MLLYGSFDTPGADTLARAVTAGGGRVMARAPPYDSAALAGEDEGGAHVVVVGASKGAGDK